MAKAHVLGARAVVGGGAALQVDGAVGDQRDAVLRGHRHVIHFEDLVAGLLADVLDDRLRDVLRKAHRLAGAGDIAEGHGGFAVGERQLSRLLDFLQRIGRGRMLEDQEGQCCEGRLEDVHEVLSVGVC